MAWRGGRGGNSVWHCTRRRLKGNANAPLLRFHRHQRVGPWWGTHRRLSASIIQELVTMGDVPVATHIHRLAHRHTPRSEQPLNCTHSPDLLRQSLTSSRDAPLDGIAFPFFVLTELAAVRWRSTDGSDTHRSSSNFYTKSMNVVTWNRAENPSP